MAEEEKAPEGKITHKQWIFCKEYIVDYNGTQAAIRAGYSPHTANEQASALLAKPSIKATIADLENARLVAASVTAETIVRNMLSLRALALEKGNLNVAAKCDDMLARVIGGGRAIKGITTNTDGTVKIEFSDKNGNV